MTDSEIDEMLEEEEEFEVGQDVYGLIFISPFISPSFIFASIIVCMKIALFSFLAADLTSRTLTKKDNLILATQFVLLPVAIALQEDLIYVYVRIANIRYDPILKETSPSATKAKFILSFMLRLLDGVYSLTVNFSLILTTETVLGIFLNFAALHFLQSIDDIAFELASEGFFGDRMETRCAVVKQTKMSRRVGDTFTNSLDTVLFMLTYSAMLSVWIYISFFADSSVDSDEEL